MNEEIKKSIRYIDRALSQLEPLRIESHKGMSVYPNQYDKMNADLRNAKLDLINIKNNKGCQYCKHSEPLNDTSNSNFATAIECEENGYYIATEYDDGDYADTGYSAYIQYCPMCGRKLEDKE